MIANIDFLRNRFARFNRECFGGELVTPRFALSRARRIIGQMVFCKPASPLSLKPAGSSYTLKVTTAYDFTEEDLEDVILHEMIHLYIKQKDISDSSMHGRCFRHHMERINREHGRHISISHKFGSAEGGTPIVKRPVLRIVALLQLNNDRTAVKVLPPQKEYIRPYAAAMMRGKRVKHIAFFFTSDPFFLRYPTSRSHNAFYADPDALARHLEGAESITEYSV